MKRADLPRVRYRNNTWALVLVTDRLAGKNIPGMIPGTILSMGEVDQKVRYHDETGACTHDGVGDGELLRPDEWWDLMVGDPNAEYDDE